MPNIYRLSGGIFVFVLAAPAVGLYLYHEKWEMIWPPLYALLTSFVMIGYEVVCRVRARV